jgi:hypothetical protein
MYPRIKKNSGKTYTIQQYTVWIEYFAPDKAVTNPRRDCKAGIG